MQTVALDVIGKAIAGEVMSDLMTRHIYCVDASILEVTPLAIVFPKSISDIQITVQIAAEYGIPLIPRGGATGITGGCLGEGIILDTTKYLNRILEINFSEKYAICEPGVIQDQLNQTIAAHGLRLGPDTSTGNRATLGGMAANNAAGSHYLHYGNMADHLQEIDLVMSNGSLATFSKAWPTFLDEKMQHLKTKYKKQIDDHFPKIKRRSSGYLLDRLSYPAQFIAGSEGSLGIITRLKVNLSPVLPPCSLLLFAFDSLESCLDAVTTVLSHSPFSLEVMDEHVLTMGKLSPLLKGKLDWLPQKAKALLVAEFEATSIPLINKDQIIISSLSEQAYVWALRKAGLGLLLSRRSYTRAIAFIEDIALPPLSLRHFVSDLKKLLSEHGKEAGIYGHAGDSCLHIRPYINLHSENDLKIMIDLMEQTTDLVKKYGGILSGEHGDGIIRSWLNPRLFGVPFEEVFAEIKKIFDPLFIMNPGKVVGGLNPIDHLRSHPKIYPTQIQTFLNFEKEGGLSLAVDLCNGNGECRKKTGLMCPSFHAEQDEKMTTRARAQGLRSILNGKLPLKEMTGKGLYEVLEYCLECKGCKTECPSQVDIAKIKAEILFHYQETHGYSLRNRLFAHIGSLYKWGSRFPYFAQKVIERENLKNRLGITLERPFPKMAPERFSSWWKRNKPSITPSSQQVVLLIDTFTEFLEPEVGKAAFEILSSLGFSVVAPKWQCCGRPAFSKGLLKQAKKHASYLIDNLYPFAEKGVPIIGLEPSCLFTVKDDYSSLSSDPRIQLIASKCHTFEDFLFPFISSLSLHNSRPIYFHVHCHEKALQGSHFIQRLLSPLRAHELNSGCCGLAGSFGYEKEHFSLSIKIGEHRLFPTLRTLPENSLIIANGFSCRSQINFGTGRKALHTAEALSFLIKPT